MGWAATRVSTLLYGGPLPAPLPCERRCVGGGSSSTRPESKKLARDSPYFPLVIFIELGISLRGGTRPVGVYILSGGGGGGGGNIFPERAPELSPLQVSEGAGFPGSCVWLYGEGRGGVKYEVVTIGLRLFIRYTLGLRLIIPHKSAVPNLLEILFIKLPNHYPPFSPFQDSLCSGARPISATDYSGPEPRREGA